MPSGQYKRKIIALEDRFWANVVTPTIGCWYWLGYTNGIGYGILTIRRRAEGIKKNIYAHRLAWELMRGPIPEGKFVCHHCDNPACVNPDHLFLGTNAENMQDCSRKGRQNGPAKSLPGTRNGNVKLTEQRVREIRKSTGNGAELARQLGVSKSLVCAIRKRRAWRHVD